MVLALTHFLPFARVYRPAMVIESLANIRRSATNVVSMCDSVKLVPISPTTPERMQGKLRGSMRILMRKCVRTYQYGFQKKTN